jgi:hypothetical protein
MDRHSMSVTSGFPDEVRTSSSAVLMRGRLALLITPQAYAASRHANRHGVAFFRTKTVMPISQKASLRRA